MENTKNGKTHAKISDSVCNGLKSVGNTDIYIYIYIYIYM